MSRRGVASATGNILFKLLEKSVIALCACAKDAAQREVQRQPACEADIGLRRREGHVYQRERHAAGGETPTRDRRGSIAAIVEQQNKPKGVRGEGPSGEIALGEKGVEAGLNAVLLVPDRNCSDRSQRWSDSVWQLKHQLPSRRYALNNTSLKH